MILKELHEAEMTFDAVKLIDEAKTAGQKLYSKHRTGLIFANEIEIIPLARYGKEYDTFDYLFRPAKDVADTRIADTDAINGVIFVGSADGVKLITLPGVKVKLINLPKKEKPSGNGTTWIVTDSHGYTYTIEPRRGVPPLPNNAEDALEMIKNNHRFGMQGVKIVKIEKK